VGENIFGAWWPENSTAFLHGIFVHDTGKKTPFRADSTTRNDLPTGA
jgi:hypothetical protein